MEKSKLLHYSTVHTYCPKFRDLLRLEIYEHRMPKIKQLFMFFSQCLAASHLVKLKTHEPFH